VNMAYCPRTFLFAASRLEPVNRGIVNIHFSWICVSNNPYLFFSVTRCL
jgi:hypothetical protein